MALLHTEQQSPCPLCGGRECIGFPDYVHRATYPFLKGGFDPMADQLFVVTQERVIDEELDRVVYGAGDCVPIADAVKYGLMTDAEARAVAKNAGDDWPAENVKRARKMAGSDKPRRETVKKPAASGGRAKRRGEDRAHKLEEDR